jgi:hypothetical protein
MSHPPAKPKPQPHQQHIPIPQSIQLQLLGFYHCVNGDIKVIPFTQIRGGGAFGERRAQILLGNSASLSVKA